MVPDPAPVAWSTVATEPVVFYTHKGTEPLPEKVAALLTRPQIIEAFMEAHAVRTIHFWQGTDGGELQQIAGWGPFDGLFDGDRHRILAYGG